MSSSDNSIIFKILSELLIRRFEDSKQHISGDEKNKRLEISKGDYRITLYPSGYLYITNQKNRDLLSCFKLIDVQPSEVDVLSEYIDALSRYVDALSSSNKTEVIDIFDMYQNHPKIKFIPRLGKFVIF